MRFCQLSTTAGRHCRTISCLNLLKYSRDKRNKTMTSLPSGRLSADCFVSRFCNSSWQTHRDLVFPQLLSLLHTKHFSHPHIKYNSLLAPSLASITILNRLIIIQSVDSRSMGRSTVGRLSTDRGLKYI